MFKPAPECANLPGARTALLSTPRGPRTPELQREVKSIPPDSHTGLVHQVGNATRGGRGHMSSTEEVENSTELLRSAEPAGEASTDGWRPQGPSVRKALRVRAGLVSTGSHQDVGRGVPYFLLSDSSDLGLVMVLLCDETISLNATESYLYYLFI